MTDVEPDVELVAYRLVDDPDVELLTAPVVRGWMHATPGRFANRCLPMLMANQCGWLLVCPCRVDLTWDGRASRDATVVEYPQGSRYEIAASHFGRGIVSWSLPYLFRTSPGWNLWVRGPTNCPKDGVYALDGIVETDWLAATFLLNWQLTRPGLTVTVQPGEPIGMLVPQRRGDLERVRPRLCDLDEDRELGKRLARWAGSRDEFIAAASNPGRATWQRHYFRGVDLEGDEHPEHQRTLRLRDFPTAPEVTPDERS